jgi:hypothetical protein
MMDSTAITRELGARLRECRERAGLKSADVARKLGWPQSKVSRLETGDRRCDPMDLSMYLGTCDVKQETAKPLLKLAQLPETGVWPRLHTKQVSDQLCTVVMNENAASTITHFHPNLIPGLLQTWGYAAAAIQASVTATPADLQPRLNARIARQELLKRHNSPDVTFYINESALHYPVCGPMEMGEQLLHLVFMAPNPWVKIRIVPLSAGAHAGMNGPFIFTGFPDRQPVVLLESEVLITLVEDREVVEIYRTIRSELDRIALDKEESRSLLASLASEYDREAEERSHGGGHLA